MKNAGGSAPLRFNARFVDGGLQPVEKQNSRASLENSGEDLRKVTSTPSEPINRTFFDGLYGTGWLSSAEERSHAIPSGGRRLIGPKK